MARGLRWMASLLVIAIAVAIALAIARSATAPPRSSWCSRSMRPTPTPGCGSIRPSAPSGNAVPELSLVERLGWAFVEAARNEEDDGYYLLAERTAGAIDTLWPGSPESALLRGHVLVNLHRFAEAEEIAQRLVADRGAPSTTGCSATL